MNAEEAISQCLAAPWAGKGSAVCSLGAASFWHSVCHCILSLGVPSSRSLLSKSGQKTA